MDLDSAPHPRPAHESQPDFARTENPWWQTGRARVVAGAAAILSAAAIAVGISSSSSPDHSGIPPGVTHTQPGLQPTECSASTSETGITAPLHVAGHQIEYGNGKRFVPYGITIYGRLEQRRPFTWPAAADNAQIKAAAKYWHANTVRIQAAQRNLFTDVPAGDTYNPRLLAAIQNEVSLAKRLGMRAVISDQTEHSERHPVNDPDLQTLHFWQVVASAFRCQANVMFDAFNEPRAEHNTSMDKLAPADWVWNMWRAGGSAQQVKYVGMQAVVNTIRATGAKNLIWVEPPYMSNGLNALRYFERYEPHGKDLVVAYHHVDFNHFQKSKDEIQAIAHSSAVVDGEYTQYAAPKRLRKECYGNAYKILPEYLAFLNKLHIGLMTWSLQSGSLVKPVAGERPIVTDVYTGNEPTEASDLSQPTTMNRHYACNEAEVGQGGGRLFMQEFARHSRRN